MTSFVLVSNLISCVVVPASSLQIQSLEREIQEKRRQMSVLEQRIIESGEASVANASLVDMQQVSLTSSLLHYPLSIIL